MERLHKGFDPTIDIKCFSRYTSRKKPKNHLIK